MTTLTLTHNPLAHLVATVAEYAAIFSAAVQVSADVETRRTPDAKALKVLGIDPASFPKQY